VKYFRVTTPGQVTNGPILVGWFWYGYYQTAYRHRTGYANFEKCAYGIPDMRRFGTSTEITEAEAMALDPDLFADGVIWDNYEQFKLHDKACEERQNDKKTKRS
jgi:hypothetical protein